MKQFFTTLLLTMLMSMVGTKASAYDLQAIREEIERKIKEVRSKKGNKNRNK